jgi:RNA polymerase sigma factor (sigma-70 family)
MQSEARVPVPLHEPDPESRPPAPPADQRASWECDFVFRGLCFNTTELVARIRRGEAASVEALCSMLRPLAYSQLRQQVDRQYIEDKFHDVVVTVLEAIENGALKQPDRLMGFVHTITHRGVVAHIRANIKRRRCTTFEESVFTRTDTGSPEAAAAQTEKLERLHALLDLLCARDRDLLTRFYLHEQLPAQICLEMHLTATQFRLYKSRALARCAATATAANTGALRPTALRLVTLPVRIGSRNT